MEKISPFTAQLLGESIAMEAAFNAAIADHPNPAKVKQHLRDAKERGISVFLGGPAPDQAREAFESRVDVILARLEAQHP